MPTFPAHFQQQSLLRPEARSFCGSRFLAPPCCRHAAAAIAAAALTAATATAIAAALAAAITAAAVTSAAVAVIIAAAICFQLLRLDCSAAAAAAIAATAINVAVAIAITAAVAVAAAITAAVAAAIIAGAATATAAAAVASPPMRCWWLSADCSSVRRYSEAEPLMREQLAEMRAAHGRASEQALLRPHNRSPTVHGRASEQALLRPHGRPPCGRPADGICVGYVTVRAR